VVVPRRQPTRDTVALLASMWEVVRHMTGRCLVVGGVARVAIRRNLAENAARMAADAVQSRVAAREREEVMADKRPFPPQGRVATLAIRNPSAGGMVRRGRPRQVGPVTQVTLDRGPAELARRCARMAVFAGRHGVGAEQREARPRVLGDQSRRPPTGLFVASLTTQSERGGVRVRVTSPASARGIELHRATIIMAAQARRPGVRALQRIARLLLMIEGEVPAKDVPALRDMAEAAVTGKRLVWDERSPPAAPPLPRRVQPTVEQGRPRRREQSDEEQSGTPIFQPHHVYRDFEEQGLCAYASHTPAFNLIGLGE
jgi:hypothetical protein